MRARELGSGVVMDPVEVLVHELVPGLVDVHVLVPVIWPVSPAKIPVPPVITSLNVVIEVLPVSVPFPVRVPNRVPPAKMSTKVRPIVNAVGLEKVVVPVFVVVKAPNTESTPEPAKLARKTAGSAVAVVVRVAVTVSDIAIESAWTGTARNTISRTTTPTRAGIRPMDMEASILNIFLPQTERLGAPPRQESVQDSQDRVIPHH